MGYLKNLKNEIYALEASPLPGDPTKPIYPFTPKPTGPTLPNREMAAHNVCNNTVVEIYIQKLVLLHLF